MQRDKVKAAIMEATRFISKANKLVKAMESDIEGGYPRLHPKESGACRRASMDLSRSLSDMRRP